MALLHIEQKASGIALKIPHKIFINNNLLGIMNCKEIRIQMPPGRYKIRVQSVVPLLGTEMMMEVSEGVENHLSFRNRERGWDVILMIDLVLWIVGFFPHLPEYWEMAYNIFTYGVFILWLGYEWLIRKKYFRMEFSRRPIMPSEE